MTQNGRAPTRREDARDRSMNAVCVIGAPVHEYEQWLLSTPRSDATIRMRLGQIRALSARIPLYSATGNDLQGILAASRHLAPETRKAMLASWRLFYKWAVRSGHMTYNPTDDLESITVKPRLPRLADDATLQIALVTATVPQRAMILLGRYACLRLSEISSLHTVDRRGDFLRIRGKGDKERPVYANEDVLTVLLQLEREQGAGFYFPGRFGWHLHPQSVNKIITRTTGCNPHSLRHAGATAAYRATKNLRGVQEMLGHASIATTQRYLHLDDDELRAVGDATRFKNPSPTSDVTA